MVLFLKNHVYNFIHSKKKNDWKTYANVKTLTFSRIVRSWAVFTFFLFISVSGIFTTSMYHFDSKKNAGFILTKTNDKCENLSNMSGRQRFNVLRVDEPRGHGAGVTRPRGEHSACLRRLGRFSETRNAAEKGFCRKTQGGNSVGGSTESGVRGAPIPGGASEATGHGRTCE